MQHLEELRATYRRESRRRHNLYMQELADKYRRGEEAIHALPTDDLVAEARAPRDLKTLPYLPPPPWVPGFAVPEGLATYTSDPDTYEVVHGLPAMPGGGEAKQGS